MRVLQSSPAKPHARMINIVMVSSSVCVVYFLLTIFLVGTSKFTRIDSYSGNVHSPTTLHHIVFGIASSQKSWVKQKEYVKLWWKKDVMRGCVYQESLSEDANRTNDGGFLPPLCVSEDTSRFRYTYRNGPRSAIRVARVVSEIVALNHSDVRWYVFGDDDTVFFPENLLKTLSKYDHKLWYYIGSNSEIYEQNRVFGFDMAFGGSGFAISYPLARVLVKVFDSCIERYPHLYGSDSRVYSCLAELGVAKTHEPGFHQIDCRGDLFGLLTSHPLTPLVSLHHSDQLDPIFPNMSSINSLQHLFKAANVDSQRILQRTICYDRWYGWTISLSWGYAVEVYGRHMFLPDVLPVQTTFTTKFKGRPLHEVYTFNTREPHPDPCRRPTMFFLDRVHSGREGITSYYKKSFVNCTYDVSSSPNKLEEIKVFSQKLDLNHKQLQAPRRHCCHILPSSAGKVLEIAVRECQEHELVYMH